VQINKSDGNTQNYNFYTIVVEFIQGTCFSLNCTAFQTPEYNLIGLFDMFVCVCRDKEVSRIMNTPNTEDVRLKRLLKAVKKL